MNRRFLVLGSLMLAAAAGAASPPGLVDHHQHLFSPAIVAGSPNLTRVTAAELVAMMDLARVRRAVVLSGAYESGNPNKPPAGDEYAKVMAENDWTAQQVKTSKRLLAFCSFNPLKDYALAELARCARNPATSKGIALHFGSSDVDLDEGLDVSRVRAVFRGANSRGMAIVVHLPPSAAMQRPFGAAQARRFLDQLMPAAPDVVVQIAHLGGAGGYDDPAIDAALGVFVEAIASRDPRVARLYFDVAAVAGVGNWTDHTAFIAARLRALGLTRVLYGSDGAASAAGTPAARLAAFRKLPLSSAEFHVIESNVAPYLR